MPPPPGPLSRPDQMGFLLLHTQRVINIIAQEIWSGDIPAAWDARKLAAHIAERFAKAANPAIAQMAHVYFSGDGELLDKVPVVVTGKLTDVFPELRDKPARKKKKPKGGRRARPS